MNLPASEASLIDRILETPPEERAEFLRRAFVENPELRDRLRQIVQAVSSLESEARTAPLPSSDTERARVFELAFARQETAGTSIGPYKLVQELGEGGFGIVWLAEQHEPIRRRVALKIIKGGMDTREVIARFEVERQSLALMDHPGIARVFDAGTTESGRPFFVMELVRGTPITRYCDENRLTIEARLRLFISVCRAVQHAHQKGVIHRDLKPSNIIVTQHDGVAAAKIIDFGIAKATGSELTERTLFTRFHAFIGTPAYTSPEQMEMSGLDVDTRSDIYSLGVLLYELLAGRPPFDPAQLLKSSLEEMRRTIREVEPPMPSQSVRALPDPQLGVVAEGRSSAPESLAGEIRGDLDWIVMHCLEKDRTRRYETASGLAADVCRYLDNETVTARPASAAYRMQKFVRRNRLAVVAGVAVVLSLATGLIVASVALVREHFARERESAMRIEADAAAERARTEAAKSEQVAHFMRDMLKGAGPSAARGRDTTMLREILDETAERLRKELGDQPGVAADLRETLALVYRDLGRQTEAEALLREVVAARRGPEGGGEAALAQSLNELGRTLLTSNRRTEAGVVVNEALEIRRRLFGPSHPTVADSLLLLSFLGGSKEDREETLRMLYEVLDIRRKAFGPDHLSVAEVLDVLGGRADAARGLGDPAILMRESLAIYRRNLGNDHPLVARVLERLAHSLHARGALSEAGALFEEAFLIHRKVSGPEHPEFVASLLAYLGDVRPSQADDETVALVRELVAEQRERLPAKAVMRVPALLLLAMIEERPDRDPAGAAAILEEAEALIAESNASSPAVSLGIANAMMDYGAYQFAAADPGAGYRMCRAGLGLLRADVEEFRGSIAYGTQVLAWTLTGMGRHEEAADQFAEALRLMRARWQSDHFLIGMCVAGRGLALRHSRRAAEAVRELSEALDQWKWGEDPGTAFPYSMAAVMCELGLALNQESRFSEAEGAFRASLKIHDKVAALGLVHRFYPRVLSEGGLGGALAGQGRFEEAEPMLLLAFESLKSREGSDAAHGAAQLGEVREAIVAFHERQGNPEEAARWRAAQ